VFGIIPYAEDGLGLDASGVISRVGPDVKDLYVGDRIMCLGSGTIATHVVTSEALCERIPSNVSFENAATLPSAFATALSLENIAHLQSGQASFPLLFCKAVLTLLMPPIVDTYPRRFE
jgi:NADPH:quinone reductase-like Zn-dependent oxidoreductase